MSILRDNTFLKWVNVHQWNIIYQLNVTEIFNGPEVV